MPLCTLFGVVINLNDEMTLNDIGGKGKGIGAMYW